MTTFYDLFGVNTNTPSNVIKQRYKLLSLRVHPDKGGSTALMQLILLAYNNILQGRGSSSISLIENEQQATANNLHEKQIYQLKQDNLNLKKRLDIIEAEKQLLLLRNSSEQAQKIALARQLKDVLYKNEINETQKRVAVTFYHKAWFYLLPPIFLLIFLFYAFKTQITPVFYQKNAINDKSITRLSSNKSPINNVVIEPRLTNKTPVVEKINEIKNTKTVLENAPQARLENRHQITLFQQVGIWQFVNKFNDKAAYIAIKSNLGSYITADCNKQFMLHLNTLHKPLRIAGNLEYVGIQQHFYLYQIRFGEGASIKNWLQSRHLKINNQSFSNDNFKQVLQQLDAACRYSV